MLFKDLKNGSTIYLLDRNEVKVNNGTVTSVSLPHYNTQVDNGMGFGMVVDVSISSDGNAGQYVLSDNKDFADMQISKMYYEDKTGKHFAPYWTESEAKDLYMKNKSSFPSDYNFYDFEVALNMIKSDYCPLLKKWEQASQSAAGNNADSHMSKILDLTINWLNDPDNPYGNEKVWGYFNSNK